ncbi:hypothetical protein Rt10032_c09g3766 [Rhodotorula toruloides]|uniref:Transmembrane protein 188 n=1 Tax=Rhodotorula toruloides TaxID=5286 RepID=A0A511KHA1_RHOTO|nr:hypothetical protein Rt10032_c09g3766 [Rhodotorula toruloides]
MSRRARTFHPSATRESFKDLLIFEERLKQNAERLQKQRRKYEAFLFSLVGVIVYLGYGVFVLPSIYSLVHYGNIAMLLVAVTTLILFFATGMYSEKIAYAHKCVRPASEPGSATLQHLPQHAAPLTLLPFPPLWFLGHHHLVTDTIRTFSQSLV